MPTVFEWISQPLLLSIAQTLGIPIPGYEDPLAVVTGGLINGETPISPTDGFSKTGILAAGTILGTAGILSGGAVAATKALSTTTVRIEEGKDVKPSWYQQLSKKDKDLLTAVGAGAALAALFAALSLSQPIAPQLPTDDEPTPYFEDPTRDVSKTAYEICIDQQIAAGKDMQAAHAYCCSTIRPLPPQCFGGTNGVRR